MATKNIDEIVLIHLYIIVRELVKRNKIIGFFDDTRKVNDVESQVIHFEFNNRYYKMARITGILDLGDSIFYNVDKENFSYLIIDDTDNKNDFDVLDYRETLNLYNKIMVKVNKL